MKIVGFFDKDDKKHYHIRIQLRQKRSIKDFIQWLWKLYSYEWTEYWYNTGGKQ